MNPVISYDFFSAQASGFAGGSLEPDWPLLLAHDLLREKADPPWRDRLYRRLRSLLALLRLAPPYVSRYDWSPALKHVPSSDASEVLLIWAVGVGTKDIQQAACLKLQEAMSVTGVNWLPVLLTDRADFAFFSRLGWLVEYLPSLGGEDEGYVVRKCRYLAWRYRGALVLPLTGDAVLHLSFAKETLHKHPSCSAI